MFQLRKRTSPLSQVSVLLAVHGLSERAVSSRVPHGKPHPLFSRRVESHTEFVAAERSHGLHIDDLPLHRISVAPYQLREFGRKGPFRFRRISSFGAGAFDAPVAKEDLTARDKKVSGAQGIH